MGEILEIQLVGVGVFYGKGFGWWLSGKESATNAADGGLIPASGRSPGEGNGNSLQYSGLKNSTDRGAPQATIHGLAKSWTRLSDFYSLTCYW